ncbi:MAG: hypothetical protein D3923_00540, partial [Candidatus Electrothrix sp. AR3]|nr:hypothetical protein [Candidatus Electrothrix sp. AR3]
MRSKQTEDKTSKVTQVLINDLRGKRTVGHNFHDWNKKKSESRTEEQRSPEKKTWKTKFGTWSLVTGLVIILLVSLVVAIWPSVFKKSVENKVVHKIDPIKKETKYIPAKKKPSKNKIKTDRKRKQKVQSKITKPKKEKLYAWTDKNGITHYTNSIETINKQPTKPRKRIIGYTVNLKKGKKIRCNQVLKIGNGQLRIIEDKIETEMPIDAIASIEQTNQT